MEKLSTLIWSGTKRQKSKGFAFICYEDQRSTTLAVDNLNGMKVCGRLVRVDHVHTYKLPKDLEKMDADRKKLFMEGCAPKPIVKEESSEEEEEEVLETHSKEKSKKKKKKKKKRKRSTSSDSDHYHWRSSEKSRRRHRSRSRD